MLVTEIAPLNYSKSKKRFKVRVEGGADFVLYKKELDKFAIVEGEEIPGETYNEILNDIFIPRAKSRALHLLERQDRTEANLRSKLRDSGYPTEAVDIAIEYVSDYNYINDYRYARNYILSKSSSKSRRRIIEDLRGKGIDKVIIQEVVYNLESDSDEPIFNDYDLIVSYVDRKLISFDDKTKRRVFEHLMRAGFSADDIHSVINERLAGVAALEEF